MSLELASFEFKKGHEPKPVIRVVKGVKQHWHDPYGWHPVSRIHKTGKVK